MRKFQVSMYALLFIVSVFFSFQCEKTFLPVDSSDKIDYLQGNTQATVIIKLFDTHSYAPISGVDVTIVGIGTSKSDSTGAVQFDSMKVGTYLATCTKNGYEGIMQNVMLTVDANSNTVPVVNQSTDAIYMAKKGAVIRGNLFYKKESSVYKVDGAKVECQLSNGSSIFQKPRVVTTSDDGTYMFNDLPEYTSYTITVLPFATGTETYKQAATIALSGRAAGDTLRAADIVLDKFTDGNFIVMSHNLETFTRTDSLEFTFSEAVDREVLTTDSIYVTLSSSGSRILTKQIWRDDDKKLVLIPFNGAWNSAQSYTLAIRKIKSITGKPLNNTEFMAYSFAPVVSGELGRVKDLKARVGVSDTTKIDYNTSSVTLLWSDLGAASSYQIYQKSSVDSAWYLYTTAVDTFISLSTSGKFNLGNKLQVLVLGQNSTSLSSFEDATVLTMQDKKRPTINYSSMSYGYNRTSYSALDTIDYMVSSSYLPEPMDTTKKPTVKVKEGSYVSGATLYGDTLYAVNAGNCFWTWTSDRSGTMSVVVDPLKNATYDTLKIDFTGLTDVAGNKADSSATAGFITVLTRP